MDINFEKVKVFILKIEWNSMIRSILYMFFCAVCIYQVISSCMEYYSYNTVVQVKIARPAKTEIPSISVCRQMTTKQYIEMLKNEDPEFRNKFEKLSSSEISAESAKGDAADVEAEKESSDLEIIQKFFDNGHRNVRRFFDIIKNSLNVTCTDIQSPDPVDCDSKAFRINSFTHRRICATFYSRLYTNFVKNESNFNISENITQKLEIQETMFAWLKIFNPLDDIFVYIHTSKSMPDINLYDLEMTKSRVFKNKSYGILYSKYSINRLESPYMTDCYNYTRNRKVADDSLSEFGCIEKCRKRFWKKTSRSKCVPIDLVVIMESDDMNETICNCTAKPCDKNVHRCKRCEEAEGSEYITRTNLCEHYCRQDCYEEYYTKEKFELEYDFESKIWKKYGIKLDVKGESLNTTIVFLAAKYQEEISYTHIPKMVSFDFFAAMGGLFSLWIGASIMTIYDVIYGSFVIGKTVRKRVLENKLLFWKTNNLSRQDSRGGKRTLECIQRNNFRPRADLSKYNYKY